MGGHGSWGRGYGGGAGPAPSPPPLVLAGFIVFLKRGQPGLDTPLPSPAHVTSLLPATARLPVSHLHHQGWLLPHPHRGPLCSDLPKPCLPSKAGQTQPPRPVSPLHCVRSKLPRTCGSPPSADNLARGVLTHAYTHRNRHRCAIDVPGTHSKQTQMDTDTKKHTRAHTQTCPPRCILQEEQRPCSQPPLEGLLWSPEGPSPPKPTVQCAGTPGGYCPSSKLMSTVPPSQGGCQD